jgi:hypothetical protein
MAVALLGGLLGEFFLGLWWVDYLATGVILAFVPNKLSSPTANFTRNINRSYFFHFSSNYLNIDLD